MAKNKTPRLINRTQSLIDMAHNTPIKRIYPEPKVAWHNEGIYPYCLDREQLSIEHHKKLLALFAPLLDSLISEHTTNLVRLMVNYGREYDMDSAEFRLASFLIRYGFNYGFFVNCVIVSRIMNQLSVTLDAMLNTQRSTVNDETKTAYEDSYAHNLVTTIEKTNRGYREPKLVMEPVDFTTRDLLENLCSIFQGDNEQVFNKEVIELVGKLADAYMDADKETEGMFWKFFYNHPYIFPKPFYNRKEYKTGQILSPLLPWFKAACPPNYPVGWTVFSENKETQTVKFSKAVKRDVDEGRGTSMLPVKWGIQFAKDYPAQLTFFSPSTTTGQYAIAFEVFQKLSYEEQVECVNWNPL
jgi:hypothetical protein